MPSSTRRSSTRRTPRGLFGSIGPTAVHSCFAEFAAHDSRLRFRSLNDIQGSAINPPASSEAANALNLLPLSEA